LLLLVVVKLVVNAGRVVAKISCDGLGRLRMSACQYVVRASP
jgi:hypothetical protein